MKKHICCICGKEFEGYGNNPWPFIKDESARCCDKCNAKVLQERMNLAKREEIKK